METVRIRDPEWKKVGSKIRDKHPGSATLARIKATDDTEPVLWIRDIFVRIRILFFRQWQTR
jgi:hypothetical protein